MIEAQEKRLLALTREEAEYQGLLRQCTAMKPEYTRILGRLSQPDREILEHYIALCEELEYRRKRSALKMNKAALG